MASKEFESKLGTLVEAVRARVTELRGAGFIPAKRPTPRPVPQSVPAAGKVVSLNPDDLIVKLADDQSEIEQSQALRYRVFYEEMGAHPTDEMTRLRRDFDDFDEPCDHLLIIDRKRGGPQAGRSQAGGGGRHLPVAALASRAGAKILFGGEIRHLAALGARRDGPRAGPCLRGAGIP